MTDLVSPGAAFFSISMAMTSLLNRLKQQTSDSDCQPTPCLKEQAQVKKSETVVSSQKKMKGTSDSNSTHLLPPDFHVAIIGGGIGGLATALALQQEGIRCTVYERDRVFEDRKQGYGLTLSNTPKGGLAKLGILEACIRQDCNSNSHWVFTPEGKILGYYGRVFKPEKASSNSGSNSPAVNNHRGNLRIPRQDLRQLLLDRLAPNTVQWHHKCQSLCEEQHEGRDGVTVTFEDRDVVVRADVVVGADGLRSRVRQLRDQGMAEHGAVQPAATAPCAGSGAGLGVKEGHDRMSTTGKEQFKQSVMKPLDGIQYIGVSVILGISSFQHPLLAQQGYYVLDGTHRLFTMPFREDKDGNTVQTMWQLSFSGLAEGEANLLKMSGSRAQLAEATRRTAGWFSSVRDLIKTTAPAEVWSTPLYDRPPMQQQKRVRGATRGRITVLGDACHPMSMFKGQGANQALEDAPRLVEWLLKQGKQFSSLTVPMRLYHFEKEMKDRTSKWVLASRSASQFLHSRAVLEEGAGSAYAIDGLERADSAALLALLAEKGITTTASEEVEVDEEEEKEGREGRKRDWTVHGTAAGCAGRLEGRVLAEFKAYMQSKTAKVGGSAGVGGAGRVEGVI